MSPAIQRLSVLVLQRPEDDGMLAAQCVNCNIGAQARTLEDLMYEFQRAVVGHLVIAAENGLEPFDSLGQVPASYLELWEQSQIWLETPHMPFQAPGALSVPELEMKYKTMPAAA